MHIEEEVKNLLEKEVEKKGTTVIFRCIPVVGCELALCVPLL